MKFSGSLNFLGRQFSGENKTKQQQIHQNLQSKLLGKEGQQRIGVGGGWGGGCCVNYLPYDHKVALLVPLVSALHHLAKSLI